MRKIVKILLLIFWMIVIYYFSNQIGYTSRELSVNVLNHAYKSISIFNNIELKTFVNNNLLLIRKLAHIGEYFILFILAYECFKEFGNKYILIYALLFVFIYACSDEYHQTFIDGRTGKLIDVLIDTFGGFLGYITIKTIGKRNDAA